MGAMNSTRIAARPVNPVADFLCRMEYSLIEIDFSNATSDIWKSTKRERKTAYTEGEATYQIANIENNSHLFTGRQLLFYRFEIIYLDVGWV